MASLSFWKVPASTSAWQRRSYSSAEPSHQYTEAGLVSAAISSTQAMSFSFFVGTVISDTRGRPPDGADGGLPNRSWNGEGGEW